MPDDEDRSLDALDVDEEQIDAGNNIVYFEREQADEDEYPDTYRKADLRERPDGTETLTVELTVRQLQGWADTMGAKLSDSRRRVGEELADVDEVYTLHLRQDGVKRDLLGVAFTYKTAKQKQAELRDDLDEPWAQDVIVDHEPFFTE